VTTTHPRTPRPGRAGVVGWVLYDLANTIFSLNIVSFYFSVWLVNVAGGTDSHVALANSLSMAVIVVLSPFLGALTDQSPRRMPFLVTSTLLCVGATLTLGRFGVVAALLAYGLANIAYQAGLQFYDALLPAVSTPRNRGRIGGIGIGMGYLGAVLGLLVGRALLGDLEGLGADARTERYVRVFTASAGLFLAFAIPAFVLVKEPVRRVVADRATAMVRAVRQVGATVRSLPRHPRLTRFLVGRILYTDAVNTVIAFMGVYVTNAVGFTAGQAQLVMLIAIVCAALGGFAWGQVVDRLGPARTLRIVLVLWVITFAWAALVGFLRLPPATFWVVPPLAGIALGGTWTADRPFLLRLTPADKVGEFYGLYGMVGRFAAVTGPLLWALVADTLGLGRPAAVASLLVFVVASMIVLAPVSDHPVEGDGDDPGHEGDLPPHPRG